MNSDFTKKLFAFKDRVKNRLDGYIDYLFFFKNWPKVIFPINRFFSGREMAMHLRNGLTVYIRDSRSKDLSAIREVIGHNDYHLERITLPKEPVIFDLGANIGTFCLMAKKAYPEAKLLAFEPHPENFSLLLKNASFATSRQVAIIDKIGTVEFQGSGSPIGFKVMTGGGLVVPATTLDEITKDCPIIDLMKIDVEGSEYAIIKSVSSATFNKIKILILEVHSTGEFTVEEGKKFIEDILVRQNFNVVWMKRSVVIARKRA